MTYSSCSVKRQCPLPFLPVTCRILFEAFLFCQLDKRKLPAPLQHPTIDRVRSKVMNSRLLLRMHTIAKQTLQGALRREVLTHCQKQEAQISQEGSSGQSDAHWGGVLGTRWSERGQQHFQGRRSRLMPASSQENEQERFLPDFHCYKQ